MSAKEDFVIDLITGDFHGAWTGDMEIGSSGRKPVIRKQADNLLESILPFLAEEESYQYELDPQKNVLTIQTFSGNQIKILKPTEDIKGIDIQQTLWHKIKDEANKELKEKRRKVKDLKREKKKMQKKINELQEEKAEQDKESNSRQTKKKSCPKCGQSFAPQKWTSRNGVCPNCNHKWNKYRKRP